MSPDYDDVAEQHILARILGTGIACMGAAFLICAALGVARFIWGLLL